MHACRSECNDRPRRSVRGSQPRSSRVWGGANGSAARAHREPETNSSAAAPSWRAHDRPRSLSGSVHMKPDKARPANSMPRPDLSSVIAESSAGLPGCPSALAEWRLRQQELGPEAAEELAQEPTGDEFCLGAELKAGCLDETGIVVVFEGASFPILVGEP